MMSNEDYSKVKLLILRTFLSLKGMFRCLWLKKGKKYHGGRNNRDGVYLGDKKFYETFYVTGLGYHYFDSKAIKYKNWELGMWKWK